MKKINISCGDDVIYDIMLDLFITTKQELQNHFTNVLKNRGIQADIHINVENNNVNIVNKTGDPGVVLVTSGGVVSLIPYRELEPYERYGLISGGIQLRVKMPNNIDVVLSVVKTIDEFLSSFNSDSIISLYENVVNRDLKTTEEQPTSPNNKEQPSN